MKSNGRSRFARFLVSALLAATVPLLSGRPASATEVYKFRGRGTAHGVGADMAGVKALAEQGKGYVSILQTYYTGISWGSRSDYETIVYKRSDGSTTTMRMRDYLARLAEEPDSWPREGLRSLIVAARSYAWNKMDTLGYVPWWGQNFLESITDPRATRPNIVQAITDTESQIMTYNGKAIVAAYHGNSGGRTESYEYVWGGTSSSYPYLKGVDSPWTPLYSWEFSLTRQQLEDILNADSATYVGTLYGIDLSNRSPSGRVYKARLIGSAGIKDVWGYSQFASKLGSKIGKSISSLIGIVPDDWEESLTITNPTSSAASINLRINGDSAAVQSTISVPAHTTKVFTADSYVSSGGVTVELSSDQPVVAERTARYLRNGYRGTYSDIGSPSTSQAWYLPDGYVGDGVDTVVAMENPQNSQATVEATFMRSGGSPIVRTFTVGPHGYRKVRLSDVAPAGWVSTRLSSNVGIVADRTMYSAYDGGSTVGAGSLAKQWYFGEGNTTGSASTRLTIQNPNAADAGVRVIFLRKAGRPISRRFTVAAGSRIQVLAERYLREGFGAQISSSLPVAADKAVYQQAGGKRSRGDTVGSSALSKRWYLPDGSSKSSTTYVSIINPNSEAAEISVRFATPDGRSRGGLFTVGGYRKLVVSAAPFVPTGTTFSTTVSSTRPVAAEKTVYSDYGVTSANGAPAASKYWYLAEGYTGP